MSAESLSGIVGVFLSLMFSYIPGVKDRYANLRASVKQTVMGILLMVFALAVYGLACAGYAADFGLTITCNRTGAVSLINILLAALVANQGTYLLTKK